MPGWDVMWRICDYPYGCQEWAEHDSFRCEQHQQDPAFEED